MDKSSPDENWQTNKTHVFWGEIAPSDHLLQIYENDEVILNSLEGFIKSGLAAGESVIIIATEDHLSALNKGLLNYGLDLDALKKDFSYIPLNAHETLAKFMRNGWPEEKLFLKTVKEVISLGRGKNNRKVRAYGEMVAILWGQGHNGATVQLEHLWNKFCETEIFCLFCAYPKTGFTQDPEESIKHICSAHTKMISGLEKSKTEVFYKNLPRGK
ncbi:MAG: hypothetical protein K0S32_1130 [Bacteroidetes bacterium]|nr:hypothetical protein [Bacteroidota bacterium]